MPEDRGDVAELSDVELLRVTMRARDAYIAQLKADVVAERASRAQYVRRITMALAPEIAPGVVAAENLPTLRWLERVDAETKVKA